MTVEGRSTAWAGNSSVATPMPMAAAMVMAIHNAPRRWPQMRITTSGMVGMKAMMKDWLWPVSQALVRITGVIIPAARLSAGSMRSVPGPDSAQRRQENRQIPPTAFRRPSAGWTKAPMMAAISRQTPPPTLSR